MSEADKILKKHVYHIYPFGNDTTRREVREFREAVLQAMEEYADQQKDEWISVEDRLPDSGQCVLLYSYSGDVSEGAWLSEKKHFAQWRWNAVLLNVSHWRPLPSPPKVSMEESK